MDFIVASQIYSLLKHSHWINSQMTCKSQSECLFQRTIFEISVVLVSFRSLYFAKDFCYFDVDNDVSNVTSCHVERHPVGRHPMESDVTSNDFPLDVTPWTVTSCHSRQRRFKCDVTSNDVPFDVTPGMVTYCWLCRQIFLNIWNGYQVEEFKYSLYVL